MSALIAAQAFSERPIDDRQLARAAVVEQIAGVRVTMKDRIVLRREQRDGDQRFDQLFGYPSAARC